MEHSLFSSLLTSLAHSLSGSSSNRISLLLVIATVGLLYLSDLSRFYTYADTNPISESDCFQKSVGHAMNYCAAKTSTEHAAQKFMAETRPRFNTVTLCTPLMLGPVVHNFRLLR
ncbi:hypothetical protein V1522DRAFT_357467 [Lipomyces starkeyi]